MPQSVLNCPSIGSLSIPITGFMAQVDDLVSSFTQEASNPTNLGALMAGGFAYRVVRAGVMGLGSSSFLLPISIAAGLGSEVSAYEFTTRTLLTTLSPHPGGEGVRTASRDTLHASRLWSWSGTGGWGEGLVTSFATFGILKGAGVLAREQNLVFQHFFQSTAMVAGYHTTALLGLTSTPEGSLARQLLCAEVVNLQLIAGSSLASHLTPTLVALERGLLASFSVQNRGRFVSEFLNSKLPELVSFIETQVLSTETTAKKNWVLHMSSNEPKDENETRESLAIPSLERSQPAVSLKNELPSAVQLLFQEIQRNLGNPNPETISPEEVRSLEKLPTAAWVPTNPRLRKSFYGHLELKPTMSSRESFQRLQETLQDPWLLSRAFSGMSKNTYASALSNLDYLKEQLPGERVREILRVNRSDLSPDMQEARADIYEALESWAEILQIMTQNGDIKTLRSTYIGKTDRLYQGMAGTYKRFLGKILPELPDEIRSQWGWDSLPSHREMILKIWKQRHRPPNP